MTRARQDKPTAPPLATTLRAALASDWRTLAALDTLAGDPAGTRRHRVHAALNELRAAGVVFEERTSKGVAEVRELPPVADGATCPACLAVVREHDDHHGQCTIGIRDCSWWAERAQRDGTDEDHAAACGPRIVPSAETMATVRALVGEPDEPSPLDALKDRAAALGRPLGAAEGFALLAEGLAAPAPPVDQAAPVEAVEVAVAPLPGPSSRCANCGAAYKRHDEGGAAKHVPGTCAAFKALPRGRPRVAPLSPPLDAPPTAADVLAEIGAPLNPERLDAVRAWASEGAAEPETSRGGSDAPRTQCPSVWQDERCEREAGHPCGSADANERHHETADRQAMWTSDAAERWAKRVEDAREVAKPRRMRAPAAGPFPREQREARIEAKPNGCRPPLCHADDIHEPSRLRGFARPLCEAHRRWVEGAGGTLAAGGLAGVVAQTRAPSTPPDLASDLRAFRRSGYATGPLIPCPHVGPRSRCEEGPLGGHIVFLGSDVVPPRGEGVVIYTPLDEPWNIETMREEIAAAAREWRAKETV